MRWTMVVALVGCGGNNGGDCADSVEIPYDGVDQDCDGADLVDVDGDGYPGTGDVDFDCDDGAAAVHPDAPEVPYDGIDQNCFDGDLIDVDGDGFPAEEMGGTDCNDDDQRINPDYADQVGDGIDRDCDGVDGRDQDGDGWASVQSRGTDCNDDQPSVYPGATEVWYDGLDQDCAGDCDYDQDGDGAVLAGAPIEDRSPCDRVAGPGAGAPVDCDEDDPTVGEVLVLSITPADGATGVPVTTDVTAVLSAADPSATIVVRDAAGGVVDGSASSADASTWTWLAAADLAGGEAHTIELTYACGPVEATFTTE